MTEVVLGIGIFLIIAAILLAIFKIHTLVEVVRGTSKQRVSKSNKLNALLFFLFLIGGFGLFFYYSSTKFNEYTLPVASEHGVVTDKLFWVTMGVTGVVFVLTHILLFYFPYKYQYKEKKKAFYYPKNDKLEILWTVVPAIVLTVLIFSGLKAWTKITAAAPEGAEVVEIMGHQFAWKVRYPGKDKQLGKYDYRLIDVDNQFGMDFTDEASFDDFTPREIHIPKGKPILFKIRSRDVLHSVFAPHFRLKMDAVPGMPTQFWFVPTKTTAEMREELGNASFNYEIACTEICGRGHFSMKILLFVDEPEDYETWYAEQKPWLSRYPDYLSKVPHDLKELASAKSGLDIE